MFYGVYLIALGRRDEALRETRRALALDPLTPTTSLQLGWVLYYARMHDESIDQLKKTLELDPNLYYAHMELGWNYAQKRMFPEATSACDRAISLAPEDKVTLATCGFVYGLAGRRAEALKHLEILKALSAKGYLDPYGMAGIYDSLDDNDLALEWLYRACREHSASIYLVRTEIWTERLRSDPGFQNLLRRMKFPQ